MDIYIPIEAIEVRTRNGITRSRVAYQNKKWNDNI